MELDDLPQPERVATVAPEELEVDGDNPNEQSDEMFGLLCENIRQKGWIGNHIIADTNGVIADGEHRWRAADEIGLEEVPVKFYDIDDADRRLWRQELNKISGEHEYQADREEIEFLLETNRSGDIEELLTATGEQDDFDDLLDGTPEFDPTPEDEQPDLDEMDKETVECPECGNDVQV